MKKILALTTLCFLGAAPALAADSKGGLFVEPVLTYETGDADVNFPSPFGSTDSEISGFGVGARLGFHVAEIVFLGVDGRYSMLSYKNDDTNIDTDATAYNLGPVVGIQMPTDFGLRVWGGLVMAGSMDVEKDQRIDLKFKDASGYRVGAGIKLASVSLNLEYQEIEYDETENQDGGVFSGNTNNIDQEYQAYILSVSFPLSI